LPLAARRKLVALDNCGISVGHAPRPAVPTSTTLNAAFHLQGAGGPHKPLQLGNNTDVSTDNGAVVHPGPQTLLIYP